MSAFSLSTLLFLLASGPLAETDRSANQPAVEVRSSIDVEIAAGGWLHTLDDAKALSAAAQLPLLLHFEAKWCGPCRKMESEVLNQSQVHQLLGKKVVGVRIDADRHPELVSEYGVKTLPTELLIEPDGTRGELQAGALSLTTYVARLERLAAGSASQVKAVAVSGEEPTRSCLIVERDGKLVGLGGYSPVALQATEEWRKGSEEFVVNHEGVDYFLQSEHEVVLFQAEPYRYIPRLHGCDLVELFSKNRAETGAIEYGAVYEGELFFFASLENKHQFQRHPSWYLDMTADGAPANADVFPFLETSSYE